MPLLDRLYTKFEYELENLYALSKYPFAKNRLLERMARSIQFVSIETTNICNANCVFCAYQYQERTTGVMTTALFNKIVDEYAEIGGGDVSLTPTVGDPLVDPDLLERIQYARSKPEITSLGLYSNMISLKRFGAEQLVASGLTGLVVSMSGFDEAMYRRVYRSKMYPKVLENIKAFARANNKAGRPVDFAIDMRVDRPLLEVFASDDYKEVADLVGAESIGVKFAYDNWAGKVSQDELLGTMRLRKPPHFRRPRISPCTEMYSGPMIYWDGKVGACGCRDVNASELIVGDANKSHIADIWFGEQIRQLREEFLTPKVRDICKQCTHYNNLSLYLRRDRAEELNAITTPRAVPAGR